MPKTITRGLWAPIVFWRLMLGPAYILTGISMTITLGFCGAGITLFVAKKLAGARFARVYIAEEE